MGYAGMEYAGMEYAGMEYVRTGCAVLIALVFAASAVSKIRDPGGFARSVPALVHVPRELVGPTAIAVVIAEIAIPVLLVIPAAASYGFALACALLAAFTVAIAFALRRGRRVPCRCFGASSAPIGRRHLVRNAALFTAAASGGLGPEGLPPPGGVAVASAAGLIGAILLVSFDEIADLFVRNS